MKRTSRGVLLILLVMFALSTFRVMPASATPRTCTHLLPISFEPEVVQWNDTGTPLWIDSDDGDASYIETNGWRYTMKSFDFQNLPATLTEDKVTLNVKLRDPDGWGTGQRLTCYVWDGSEWVLGADWFYDTPVDRSWIILRKDITSILDTKSKIDKARVYFQKRTAGGHRIRITFCWLVVGTVLGEAPPYPDEFTMTSGEGGHIASVNKTSGVLQVWTLADIIGQTMTYAHAELWKNVYVAEESNPISIYYDYAAKGYVKAKGLAMASGGLELYVEDSDGNRIWTKTLIDVYLEFDKEETIDMRDARFEDPVSVPCPGVYRVGVILDAVSVVETVGVGLCDFLMDDCGVQVSLIIYPNFPPNTPSKPSGPTSGHLGVEYWYSTSTTDPEGDDVRYQFDWGDGTTMTTCLYLSGTTVERCHSWSSDGVYYVRVQAQDSHGVWSDWSSSLAVSISLPVLSISASYGGTTDPVPGTYTYNYGESVTVWAYADPGYDFDVWLLDGVPVYENPISVTMDSDHDLTAQFVYVGFPPNTPSTPEGPSSGNVQTTYDYFTSTTDPDSNNIRYQFDWGDGTKTTTGWYANGTTAQASYSWFSEGTYYVKVRAQDGNGLWSNWSSSLEVEITSSGGGGGGGQDKPTFKSESEPRP